MAKLKNIIKQLTQRDYEAIYTSLIESNAEKSAYLLKAIRERQLADSTIMKELEVNTNAYYTLRSRLNIKIEEHLLQQMESPRTDILKKVANITEIIFTKKKDIAVATLKKLEKELLDYDLSNELTVVYKSLKKLHLNSPDYFSYSQLYNRHIAYMLAIDKAEDLLAEYFKKYGQYSLSGDEIDKIGLGLLLKEINNVADLYESHRLYVYESCVIIFHRLFVDQEETMDEGEEPIEDILDNVEKIFEQYQQDAIYYHLNLVFEFLKLEYYTHFTVYRKAEHFYEEVNEASDNLMVNYTAFTFPAQFLITKIKRHLRLGTESSLHDENLVIFQDFELDKMDAPNYITYVMYRAISSYYAGKYEEASKWINSLLNDVNIKKYPYAHVEIKIMLAIQYCMLNDFELFNQLINSIQRQIRLLDKTKCEHIVFYTKLLKTAIADIKRNKFDKLTKMVERFEEVNAPYFSPTSLIKLKGDFANRVAKRNIF